jgi:hypothetical protein
MWPGRGKKDGLEYTIRWSTFFERYFEEGIIIEERLV